MNYLTKEFADKLWKNIKKKHGQSRKKYVSIECREEYNRTIRTLNKTCYFFVTTGAIQE